MCARFPLGAVHCEGFYPQAGPDGSLYVQVQCGMGNVVLSYLARSTDEGATWPLVGAIPYGDELRVDGAGNLYLGRTNPVDDSPLLQISRDGGRSWTQPLRVTPPGVLAHSHHPEQNAFESGVRALYWPKEFTSYQWYFDVKEPGQVAFNFYGLQHGRTTWDAFIAETGDAFDADPVFWAAPVNPPAMSMTDGAFAGEYSSGNEHNGLSFGPDGSPWASFTDGTLGYAGRLFWPTTGRS